MKKLDVAKLHEHEELRGAGWPIYRQRGLLLWGIPLTVVMGHYARKKQTFQSRFHCFEFLEKSLCSLFPKIISAILKKKIKFFNETMKRYKLIDIPV